MAHRRYIKRNGKVYGPYLYESKRINGKVKNVYHGLDKSGAWKKAGILFIIFAVLLLGAVYAEFGIQSGSSSGAISELAVWDQGSGGIDNSTWLSNCTGTFNPPGTLCLPGKATSQWALLFYANYSNQTVGPVIGNCSARFNYTGTYSPFSEMVYNPGSKLYEFNSSFERRSNYSTQFMLQVNCSNSTYDTLDAIDYFEIRNSEPYKSYPVGEGPSTQVCNEDTACTYNASANFTDDDNNDLPLSSFAINTTSSILSTCSLSISGNGIITVLCTNSSQAGTYNSFITVTDTAGASSASLTVPYTINAVNDYPLITSSLTQSCTEDSACSFYINSFDEENGTISSGAGSGIGSLTFANNGSLFTVDSANGSISFTPTNAQVGTHRIEINATDPNSATNSSILTLTISNANDAPNLFYACNNTNNTILTEDVTFSCLLNATDIDEDDTHTYSANYSWFTIDCTNVAVTNGNTSCNVTFIPTDIAVFSHWVNLTVTDSGGLTSSHIINFSVNNAPDYPVWQNISNMTAWANTSFWYRVNASDDDVLTQYSETIQYFDNTSLFNISNTTGIISMTAAQVSANVGTHWINITVNDTAGLENTTMVNFTIYANSYPYIIIRQEYNMTEGYAFSLNISANATTDEGETLTYSDNSTLFNIDSATGVISFTPADNNVGTHWVQINISDNHGTTNTSIFNFTVYNENDAPVLGPVYNITNTSEGTAIAFNLNLTDADLNISGGSESIQILANATWPGTTNLLNLSISVSNATNGRISLDVSFTPGVDSNGTYWINISINDSAGAGDSQIFMINISEGGFSPFFIDVYAGFCLTRTATEDSAFASGCTIWACDNDTSGTLRFDSNYSWFAFNESNLATSKGSPPGTEWEYCASTTVNFTPAYSEVSNWSIYLNVTDNSGFTGNYTLYFNISSVNDAPVLNYIQPLNASISATFSLYANASDEEDGNVSGGAGAISNLTFSDNTTLFEINSTTGLITWTPNSSHSGVHFINITVNDTQGKEDSQVINITVATNVGPACSGMVVYYPSPTIYIPSISPGTEHPVLNMSENKKATISATCTDAESDTITYNWYWNMSLNQTNTSNSFNYPITYLDSGYYNLTLVVYDTFGITHNNSYYSTANVSNINAPPMMHSNIPNISSLNSGNGWYNNVQNSRNLTTWFYDLDNDNLSYSWHRQAINETFSDNSISRINSIWTLSGNWTLINDSGNIAIRQNATSGLKYAQPGTMNYTNITEFKTRIKLLSSGGAGICFGSAGCSASGQRVFFNSTDNKTYLEYLSAGALTGSINSGSITIARNTSYWIWATAESNRTLVRTSSNGTDWDLAYNQTGNASEGSVYLFTINSEAVFDDISLKDPSLRNMTLNDEGGDNVSFTPKTGWNGDLQIIIRASDGINYTDSNEFNLHVDPVTVPPPEVVTQTSTSTSTATQTKVADMSIIVPSLISLTPLSKTIIPVVLRNTGQLNLNTVTLTAESNQSELQLSLNESSWELIPIGDSVQVNLEVDIGLLAPDRYTIRLEGISQSPYLERTAEIVVDVREKDAVLKAQLKEMIQFTRDLFLQNPECLELSELITEAERLMSVYQYQDGLELIHRANQGCKEFIASEEKEEKAKFAPLTFIQQHWKTIVLEVVGLVLAILLLIYYFQRRSASKV